MIAQPTIKHRDEFAADGLSMLWQNLGFEKYTLDHAIFGSGACFLNGATAKTDFLNQVYRTPSTSRNATMMFAVSRAVDQRKVCLCFDPNMTARDRAETFLIGLTLYISGIGLSLVRNAVDVNETDTSFPTVADEVLFGRFTAARILDDALFVPRLEEALRLSRALPSPSETRDLITELADGLDF